MDIEALANLHAQRSKQSSDGNNGLRKNSEKIARAIPKKYLELAYGVNKMLKEWFIAVTYKIVPIQENIEKNWKNRAAVVTENVLSMMKTCLILHRFFCFGVPNVYMYLL